MYRLRTQTDFDAAHHLENYEGKCARLHGHLWVVEVFVLGKELDKAGLLVDFGVIKTALNKITDGRLDHQNLNDIKEIGNPTCENVARYIFSSLKPSIPKEVLLEKVRVWETPRSWGEYFE